MLISSSCYILFLLQCNSLLHPKKGNFWWLKSNFVGYISAAISGGPGCLSLRCPDPSCGSMVLQGMVNKLAKDEDKEKYARFLLRAYVEGSKKVNKFEQADWFFKLHGSFCFISCSFFCSNSFIAFIISCRLNGVQLLTVHVQWSFLVTRTMMSYAIASSIFAGMYAGSILLMT